MIIIYIIGIIAAIIACLVLFIFMIILKHKVKGYLLKSFGKTIDGIVENYTKTTDKKDIECNEYIVTGHYYKGTKKIKFEDTFSINIVHLEWANRGGLVDTPRLATTIKDLESQFSKGSAVDVTYVPFLSFIKDFKYHKHPNELIDEERIREYNKKHHLD